MQNKLKKIILVIFMLLVILNTTFTIRAEGYSSNNYTSLGDSIAYGMSASQGNGYVDHFYNYLKSLSSNSKMDKYHHCIF